MARRQDLESLKDPGNGSGRTAQRRRTRAAIVEAAMRLVVVGAYPSVDDIATAADVSRRTVYMYFPTLDQLLLDAMIGALSATTMEAVLTSQAEATADDDAVARVDSLVRTIVGLAPTTLPLGRKIIQLTVDTPGAPDDDASNSRTSGPRRGYRRIGWIEQAIEPLRIVLSPEQFDRLVSALSVVVGWEAMIVLRDVRGLAPDREEEVLRWTATALVRSMLAEALGPGSSG